MMVDHERQPVFVPGVVNYALGGLIIREDLARFQRVRHAGSSANCLGRWDSGRADIDCLFRHEEVNEPPLGGEHLRGVIHWLMTPVREHRGPEGVAIFAEPQRPRRTAADAQMFQWLSDDGGPRPTAVPSPWEPSENQSHQRNKADRPRSLDLEVAETMSAIR